MRGVGGVVGGLLAGLAVGALGYALTFAYSADVPLLVCLTAGVLAAVVALSLRVLPPEDASTLLPTEPRRVTVATSFGDLRSTEVRLSTAVGDQDRFEDRLQPHLTALAVELIRQRLGLRWPAQRALVREQVDPAVWELLSAPPGSFRAEWSRVESWVAGLEDLAASGGVPAVSTDLTEGAAR